jgi:hypothetical protein
MYSVMRVWRRARVMWIWTGAFGWSLSKFHAYKQALLNIQASGCCLLALSEFLFKQTGIPRTHPSFIDIILKLVKLVVRLMYMITINDNMTSIYYWKIPLNVGAQQIFVDTCPLGDWQRTINKFMLFLFGAHQTGTCHKPAHCHQIYLWMISSSSLHVQFHGHYCVISGLLHPDTDSSSPMKHCSAHASSNEFKNYPLEWECLNAHPDLIWSREIASEDNENVSYVSELETCSKCMALDFSTPCSCELHKH